MGEKFGITLSARAMGYETRLFDNTKVHTVDIVMDDFDSFLETCTNEEYTPCTVVIDGEAEKNVGLRAKGNTSLTNVKNYGNNRYSFKIEFDHYDSTNTYHGLDKLCLNNIIQDNTYMKDFLCYTLMGDFGVSSPLCSFAYITVNGEDFGLYLAVEGIEESFLERNYGSDYGELYKPDSQSMGGGKGNGKDFDASQFEQFEQQAGDAYQNSADQNSADQNAANQTGEGQSSDAGNAQNGTDTQQSGGDFAPPNLGGNGTGTTENSNGSDTAEGTNGTDGQTDRPTPPGGFSGGQNLFGNFPGSFPDSNSDGQSSADGQTSSDGSFDRQTPPGGFSQGQPFSDGQNSSDGQTPPDLPSDEQTGQGNDGFRGNSDGNGTDGNRPDGNRQDGSGQKGGQPGGGMMNGSSDVLLQYTDDDFDSYQNIFDNAKTDVGDSDKTRLINSLKNLTERQNIENTVDTDAVTRYFVVHNFVLNFDSYTGSMIHNYYLYEKDGVLSMIPWDYNLAFGGFESSSDAQSLVNFPIDTPVSGGSAENRPMLYWMLADESYLENYHEIFSQFISKYFDSGYFEQLIDSTAELISPYVQKDPTKFCTYEEFEQGVSTLKQFCLLRAQSVKGQLEGTIPSTSDGQAEDSSNLISADGITVSDMGSMGNMGGGNMGGNRNGNMNENIGGTNGGQMGNGGANPFERDGQGSADNSGQSSGGNSDQPAADSPEIQTGANNVG